MTTAHELEQGEVLSPAETARVLGVSTRTLKRYRAAQRITPAFYTPSGHARFAMEDVIRLRNERDQPFQAPVGA
jgi:predicted site-specific integrase-resolvase